MDNRALVSIGLMVYNHEAFIEDCLKSLLQQDYSNMELIILDDASTDRSREIILRYCDKLREKFCHVTFLYHNRNCGKIPQNMNELIGQAQGEFYKGFSGDDIMRPACISCLVECMQMHPEVSIVYSNGHVIDDNFRLEKHSGTGTKIFLQKPINDTCENTFRKLMFGIGPSSPSAMFRKIVYERYGPYDESIPYEDYEYWLRICRKERFFYLDEDLIYYRKSVNSLTNYRGSAGKRKVKKSILSDHMTIQRYLRYLPSVDRKRAIALYYQKYYQLSYEANFYRGFIVTAYKIRRLGVDFPLDFWNRFCQMVIGTINCKM
jgi:hypothetical protein